MDNLVANPIEFADITDPRGKRTARRITREVIEFWQDDVMARLRSGDNVRVEQAKPRKWHDVFLVGERRPFKIMCSDGTVKWWSGKDGKFVKPE